jgi:hypothetical protein
VESIPYLSKGGNFLYLRMEKAYLWVVVMEGNCKNGEKALPDK